jgi:hypothetical protein
MSYDAMAARAAALITRKGGAFVWRQTTPGTLDPITDTMTGGATTETTIRAALLPPGTSRDFEPGALIGRNIVEAWIAADVALTPQPGDILVAGGHEWTALTITEYAPDGGVVIAWKAYLER